MMIGELYVTSSGVRDTVDLRGEVACVGTGRRCYHLPSCSVWQGSPTTREAERLTATVNPSRLFPV